MNNTDWQPSDGIILEPEAKKAIFDNSHNILVHAGPGTGKTEFLAQKASFLLETELCKFPYQILAISFKRDAAYNIDQRVKERCGSKAPRFRSYTFDAFAKEIFKF